MHLMLSGGTNNYFKNFVRPIFFSKSRPRTFRTLGWYSTIIQRTSFRWKQLDTSPRCCSQWYARCWFSRPPIGCCCCRSARCIRQEHQRDRQSKQCCRTYWVILPRPSLWSFYYKLVQITVFSETPWVLKNAAQINPHATVRQCTLDSGPYLEPSEHEWFIEGRLSAKSTARKPAPL